MTSLRLIAQTDDRFADFSPYVSSINNHGIVAFQAALKSGGTGVFTGDGSEITQIVGPDQGEFVSHPDINDSGTISVYTKRSVYVPGKGPIVDSFEQIGPLGPTMNNAGAIAFRAGAKGIHVVLGDALTEIASSEFEGFQGLPVINASGDVTFRADRKGGGNGIYLRRNRIETVAETGDRFRELGRFPCLNEDGVVSFVATLKDGNSGIFTAKGGVITQELDSSGLFESFRGALINSRNTIVFYATPKGGKLGIYLGEQDRILGLDDPCQGSIVTDLALNPVSLNDRDQVAIRISLKDGRQMIVRADLNSANFAKREKNRVPFKG